MQAAQLQRYAKDYRLTVNEVPLPTLGSTDVLVRVKVAALNPLEDLIGTGQLKLIQGYRLPVTMGNEVTGVVDQVGVQVTAVAPGDAIYTRLPVAHLGGFAEYVAVDQAAVARLPQSLDFRTGAAAALTGLTAYQGLHEELHARAGQTLFIPGGSGSFGQMAVPLAKTMGLTVIVSGNAAARERTLALGADRYLDYRTENYWELLTNVDLVIDTLGAAELSHELAIMARGGRLLSLKAGPNRQFALRQHLPRWKTWLFGLAGRRLDRLARAYGVTYRFIFVRSSGSQLTEIAHVIDQRHIVPAVDPTHFDLTEINDALKYLRQGHPQGKVLLEMDATPVTPAETLP